MARGRGPKDPFAALPTRALWEAEATGLELRVLGCVCWHDRLSKQKGGAGCYAANLTMAAEVGCTITSFSRALSAWVRRGYIERDYRGVPGKRHLTVYRVKYDPADVETIAQRGKDYLPKGAPDESQSFARDERASEQSFVRGNPENPENPPRVEAQETSLREGRDSSEDEGIDSAEAARFAARPASKSYFTDNAGGQLSRFERDWKANLDRYQVGKLEEWLAYCEQVQETFECGDPEFGQAQRLASEIDIRLDELGSGRLQSSEAA